MVEYIGNKLDDSRPRFGRAQALRSLNREFVLEIVNGHVTLMHRNEKIKEYIHRPADFGYGFSTYGQLLAYTNSAVVVFGIEYADKPKAGRIDESTRYLLLRDDGDIIIGDKNGVKWSSGTAVDNVPLSKYRLKNVAYSPVSTSPSAMTFTSVPVENTSTIAQTNSITLAWSETESFDVKFDQSEQWGINGKVSLEVGIPFFNSAKAAIEMGTSYGETTTMSTSSSVTKTTQFSMNLQVHTPPFSTVKVFATGTKVTVSAIHFTGEMEITYGDGKVDTWPTSGTMKSDGIFSEVNIKYEQYDANGNKVHAPQASINNVEKPTK